MLIKLFKTKIESKLLIKLENKFGIGEKIIPLETHMWQIIMKEAVFQANLIKEQKLGIYLTQML